MSAENLEKIKTKHEIFATLVFLLLISLLSKVSYANSYLELNGDKFDYFSKGILLYFDSSTEEIGIRSRDIVSINGNSLILDLTYFPQKDLINQFIDTFKNYLTDYSYIYPAFFKINTSSGTSYFRIVSISQSSDQKVYFYVVPSFKSLESYLSDLSTIEVSLVREKTKDSFMGILNLSQSGVYQLNMTLYDMFGNPHPSLSPPFVFDIDPPVVNYTIEPQYNTLADDVEIIDAKLNKDDFLFKKIVLYAEDNYSQVKEMNISFKAYSDDSLIYSHFYNTETPAKKLTFEIDHAFLETFIDYNALYLNTEPYKDFVFVIYINATDNEGFFVSRIFNFKYRFYKNLIQVESNPPGVLFNNYYILNGSVLDDYDYSHRLNINFTYDFGYFSDFIDFNPDFVDTELSYSGFVNDPMERIYYVYDENFLRGNNNDEFSSELLQNDYYLIQSVYFPNTLPNHDREIYLSFLNGHFNLINRYQFKDFFIEQELFIYFDDAPPNISLQTDNDKYGTENYSTLILGENLGNSSENLGEFTLVFKLKDDLLNKGVNVPYFINLSINEGISFNQTEFVCYEARCEVKLKLLDSDGNPFESVEDLNSAYDPYEIINAKISVRDIMGNEVTKDHSFYLIINETKSVRELNLSMKEYELLAPEIYVNVFYMLPLEFLSPSFFITSIEHPINFKVFFEISSPINDLRDYYYNIYVNTSRLDNIKNVESGVLENGQNHKILVIDEKNVWNIINFPSSDLPTGVDLKFLLKIVDSENNSISNFSSETRNVDLFKFFWDKSIVNLPYVKYGNVFVLNSSNWEDNLNVVLNYNFIDVFVRYFTIVSLKSSLKYSSSLLHNDVTFDLSKYSSEHMSTVNLTLPSNLPDGTPIIPEMPFKFRLQFYTEKSTVFDDISYFVFDDETPNVSINLLGDEFGNSDFGVLEISNNLNDSGSAIGEFSLMLNISDDLINKYRFLWAQKPNLKYKIKLENVGENALVLNESEVEIDLSALNYSDLHDSNVVFIKKIKLLSSTGLSLTSSDELRSQYANKVFNLSIRITDPSRKVYTKNYTLFIVDSLSDEKEKTVVFNFSNYNVFGDFAILPPIPEVWISNFSCEDYPVDDKTYSLDYRIEGTHIFFNTRVDHDDVYIFNCLAETNVGKDYNVLLNLIVDTTPPKLSVLGFDYSIDDRNVSVVKSKALDYEDYIIVPDGFTNLSLTLKTEDEFTNIKSVLIRSVLGELNLSNIATKSYEFSVNISVSEVEIWLFDSLGNSQNYILHIVGLSPAFIFSQVHPENLMLSDILNEKYCLNALEFKWLLGDKVDFTFEVEDPSYFSDANLLKELISLPGSYFYVSDKTLYVNITLRDLRPQYNEITLPVYESMFNQSIGNLCLKIYKLSDENEVSVSPTKFSTIPENFTFLFNKPVDFCIGNIKPADTSQEPFEFTLKPLVNDYEYNYSIMYWDHVKEVSSEFIVSEHESLDYQIDLHCQNYILNTTFDFTTYVTHDTSLGIADFFIKNAIVLEQWSKMSKIITNPGSPIDVEFSSAEKLKCYAKMRDKNITLSDGFETSGKGTLIFSMPGFYHVPVFCEDEAGNSGLNHILFVNVTNTPFKYEVSNIYPYAVLLSFYSTKEATCEVKNIDDEILQEQTLIKAGSLYWRQISVSKYENASIIMCDFGDATTIINLSQIIPDNKFFNRALDFNLSEYQKEYLLNVKTYRPVNFLFFVKQYEELLLYLSRMTSTHSFKIPKIPDNISVNINYEDLIKNEKNTQSLSLTVNDTNLVNGIIIHPVEKFLYPYIVFEVFSRDIIKTQEHLTLKMNEVSIDLSSCNRIISNYGVIFSCYLEEYPEIETNISLYYDNILLDSKVVPKKYYFAFNLPVGSYNMNRFYVTITFNAREFVEEPRLLLIDSEDDRVEEIMLGDYVTYFEYNETTDEFNLEIIYPVQFDVASGTQRKFVLVAYSYPFMSNVVPLYIDLREPELEFS